MSLVTIPIAASRAAGLALAVDDPAAPEVVGRDLDLHPVARVDADPVAPHLAGGVAEGLVAVVEGDLVHAVAEGPDDLALELHLLLFSGPAHRILRSPAGGLTAATR